MNKQTKVVKQGKTTRLTEIDRFIQRQWCLAKVEWRYWDGLYNQQLQVIKGGPKKICQSLHYTMLPEFVLKDLRGRIHKGIVRHNALTLSIEPRPHHLSMDRELSQLKDLGGRNQPWRWLRTSTLQAYRRDMNLLIEEVQSEKVRWARKMGDIKRWAANEHGAQYDPDDYGVELIISRYHLDYKVKELGHVPMFLCDLMEEWAREAGPIF